jgi:hypothetical protein
MRFAVKGEACDSMVSRRRAICLALVPIGALGLTWASPCGWRWSWIRGREWAGELAATIRQAPELARFRHTAELAHDQQR